MIYKFDSTIIKMPDKDATFIAIPVKAKFDGVDYLIQLRENIING